MTAPDPCLDPAAAIIALIQHLLGLAFDPDGPCPPLGGGMTTVRFFAGDGAPLGIWDENCTMLLWVRVIGRYWSRNFPDPGTSTEPCTCPLIPVLAIEVGVARCVTLDDNVTLAAYEREAAVSLDDSWRLFEVLKKIKARLLYLRYSQVGIGTLAPFGPEGDTIAWTSHVYVQL